MSKKMLLREITLPSLLQKEKISIHKYDTLILDVQGAELEVLKGIPEINKKFTRLQVEACNFPLYKGAPVFEEIDNYIKKQGYALISKNIFAQDSNRKQCMNLRYSLL